MFLFNFNRFKNDFYILENLDDGKFELKKRFKK